MGLLAALVSAFSATAKDIVSKHIASRVDPDTSTFASFAFALPYYAALMLLAYVAGWETFSVSARFLMLVVLRSLTDVVAEGCKMRALAHGDVSLVSCLLALSPLFLVVSSPFVTGDPVEPVEALGILMLVTGSVSLVRKDRTTGRVVQLRAILYAVLASVGMALNSCFDRLAVVSGGPIFAAFAMTFAAALFTAPFVLERSAFHTELKSQRNGFLLRGLFETIFMVSKLSALGFLSAPIVVGVSRLSILLSVAAGRIWFGEENTGRRLAGAALIYGGIVLLLVAASL